jgi:hypothetical protein
MALSSPQLIEAGITTCTYAELRLSGSEITAIAMGVTLGEFGEFAATFTFVQKKQETPMRLVFIEMKLGNIPFDAIVSYLTNAYGPPAPTQAPLKGDKMRLSTPAESKEWSNIGSTISVKNFVGKAMSGSYLNTRHWSMRR